MDFVRQQTGLTDKLLTPIFIQFFVEINVQAITYQADILVAFELFDILICRMQLP